MPEQLTAELLKILRAVRVHSHASASLAGKLIAAADTRPQPPDACDEKPLVEQLARVLYRQCYCRRFEGILKEESLYHAPDDEFVAGLSEANTGREYLDRGWVIVRLLPTGHYIAQKNGQVRTLAAGEFVAHDGPGAALREGANISIFCLRESKTLHPGFYFIFGESITDQQDDDNLLRFYWNIRAEGAPSLVRLLTGRLNRFQIPFRLKCLNNPAAYMRSDAVVLYLNRRFYRLAAELLADAHRETEKHLSPDTPLFSKRLAAGLGLAEEPGNGESFGQQRCRVLARGIWNAHERNLKTDEQRLEEIRRQFESEGLKLEVAYLNPGSADKYEFPTRTAEI